MNKMLTQTFENVYENNRKRNGIEICADILMVAKKGAKKSHIVYKANLNFKLLNKYLDQLRNSDLIVKSTKNNLFKTTEKGIEYLNHFRELRDFFLSDFVIQSK